jgi:hypothetical protein
MAWLLLLVPEILILMVWVAYDVGWDRGYDACAEGRGIIRAARSSSPPPP